MRCSESLMELAEIGALYSMLEPGVGSFWRVSGLQMGGRWAQAYLEFRLEVDLGYLSEQLCLAAVARKSHTVIF